MSFWSLILGATMGAVAGSTATALADRYENLHSFISGRSQCPHCRHHLAWYELIPLVSWIILQGRCRHCRRPIGWSTFVIELFATSVSVWFASIYEPSWLWLWFGLMLIQLCALVLVDVTEQLLPDRLLLFALPWVLLLGLQLPTLRLQPLNVLTGAAVVGGIIGGIYVLTRGRGMGFGDVKLAGLIGLGLGVNQGLTALFLAFTAGGALAAMLLITRRAKVGARIAFGPFLIAAYIATLFVGPYLVAWYSGY